MNSWISLELEKIDIKTNKLLNEFEKIKSNVSPKLFKTCFQPKVDKLKNCYNGNSNVSIHDVQDECMYSINNYYEYGGYDEGHEDDEDDEDECN